jgi:hypothetical protein
LAEIGADLLDSDHEPEDHEDDGRGSGVVKKIERDFQLE